MNAVNIFGIFGGACRFIPQTRGLVDSPHGQRVCRFAPRTRDLPIRPTDKGLADSSHGQVVRQFSQQTKNDIPAIILFI